MFVFWTVKTAHTNTIFIIIVFVCVCVRVQVDRLRHHLHKAEPDAWDHNRCNQLLHLPHQQEEGMGATSKPF